MAALFLDMKNSNSSSFLTLLALTLVTGVLGASLVFAQASQELFYYLMPPSSEFTINESLIINESSSQGRMVFQTAEEEKISASEELKGLQIVSPGFQVQIKPETHVTISDQLSLDAGSIHVLSSPDVTDTQHLGVGDLLLSFQGAEFIAFVSGETAETIVKVIDGEVDIENASSNQQATLAAEEATSTDDSGRLLIPFPFEAEELNTWWADRSYEFSYTELPIADAGADQTVLGNIPVQLDGSASRFQTGDIFEWRLAQGPKDKNGKLIDQVAFDSTDIVRPLFTPVVDGEYLFELQIANQDGEESNTDVVTISVGTEYLQPTSIFPDVPTEHPNNLAITYLFKKKVMMGSKDPETEKSIFRPEKNLNRAEILVTIFRNLNESLPAEEDLDEQIFTDVKSTHWFGPAVQLGKEQGIIKGYEGDLFLPANNVNLVEALKMIVESNEISLDSYQLEGQKPYPDTEIDAWYNPYLFFVKKYNLFDVDSNGNINPGQPLSRAEFAEIIYRIESINLKEKRGFLAGSLKEEGTGLGIADADIFIYKAISEQGSGESAFVDKGELYFKTTTKSDGSFNVSLPIHTKYYIEAVSEESVSNNKVITEVTEEKTTTIELEIKAE